MSTAQYKLLISFNCIKTILIFHLILSDVRVNLGVQFLKLDPATKNYIGVDDSDNAAPIPNLLNCLYRDVDVRIGNRSMYNHSGYNIQVFNILNSLGTNLR